MSRLLKSEAFETRIPVVNRGREKVALQEWLASPSDRGEDAPLLASAGRPSARKERGTVRDAKMPGTARGNIWRVKLEEEDPLEEVTIDEPLSGSEKEDPAPTLGGPRITLSGPIGAHQARVRQP